jgi:hypothetical protein
VATVKISMDVDVFLTAAVPRTRLETEILDRYIWVVVETVTAEEALLLIEQADAQVAVRTA